MKDIETNTIQNIARIVLGLMMVFAAFGHFAFHRQEFQAQVPDWIPISKDAVVIISGIFELALGLGMIFWSQQKVSDWFIPRDILHSHISGQHCSICE